jgi:hypothetical protein
MPPHTSILGPPASAYRALLRSLLVSLTACSSAAPPSYGLGNSDAGQRSRPDDAEGDGDAKDDEDEEVLDGGIEDTCGAVTIPTTAEVVSDHGNVLIVFDQSLSMTTPFSGQPLWKAASDAVRNALTPHQKSLTAGAVFFPTTDDILFISCTPDLVASIDTPPQIPFQPGSAFLKSWATRWSQAGLHAGTPTEIALGVGATALEAADLEGETMVLLVTDGASTCKRVTPSSESLAKGWLDAGIHTYVIGLPGSGPAETTLNAIAMAGGTAKYFTPADSKALTEELSRILGKILKPTLNSCVINFDQVPEDLDQIDLVVTASESGKRFRVLAGDNGWQALPDDRGAELLGDTCQDAIGGAFSSVSFEFGCEDIPIL